MDYINKICELLKQKQENNELFDEEDINKIIKWIVDDEQLHDYIKKIIFKSNMKGNASYLRSNQSISINLKKISCYCKNFVNNVDMLCVIFHEINHAKQYRIIENNRDNNNLAKKRLILELILGDQEFLKKKGALFGNLDMTPDEMKEIIDSCMEYENFYTSIQGYTSLFSERQAEYEAIEKCLLILDQINSTESRRLYEDYRRTKYQVMLKGYKLLLFCVKYPFQNFKSKIGLYDPDGTVDLNINNYLDSMTLEERLVHGFPISRKEFKKIDLLIHT